jgi:peroxiredoxin
MALRLGDEAPDFTADTTEGPIRFHDWIGNGWAILFSHPKDFTPVCTTELGYMAGLKDEFAKRNTKILGLSIDPVADHNRWLKDIEDATGHKVNYPLIGDPELKIAKLYDMIHPNASAQTNKTAADNATIRSDEHRAQLRRGAARARFDATHRQAQGGHPGELERRRRRDHPGVDPGRRCENAVSAGLARSQAISACDQAA